MTQNEAGRYGASLVAFLLGGYLLLSVNLGFIVQGSRGLGPEAYAPLIIALFVAVAAIVLHPASGARRGLALAIFGVGVILILIFTIANLTGGISLGRELGMFIRTVLRWDSVVVTLLLAAWLIVRRSSPISFVFLPLTVLIGVVGLFMLLQNVPSLFAMNVINFVALVVSVGIAWIAAGLSRRRRMDASLSQPSGPTYAPVPGAPAGSPYAANQASVPPAAPVSPTPPQSTPPNSTPPTL